MVHERNRTVAEAIERALRYAPAEAQSMVDRGQVFTARAMLRTLGGKAYKQFVVARPWREGVPGFLRAGILVAFHFYVWAAFWQLSGAKRTPEDDDLMRRVGHVVETLRMPGRIAQTGRSARQAWPSRLTPLERRRRVSPSQSVAAKRSSESVPRTSSRLSAKRSHDGRFLPGSIATGGECSRRSRPPARPRGSFAP